MSRPPELVLVVDDDEDVVRFVELRLRLEGFSVATASDGEEALRQALELRPDLVLLDVMMPHVDGFEVCARLRRDGRTRNIPIIVAKSGVTSMPPWKRKLSAASGSCVGM